MIKCYPSFKIVCLDYVYNNRGATPGSIYQFESFHSFFTPFLSAQSGTHLCIVFCGGRGRVVIVGTDLIYTSRTDVFGRNFYLGSGSIF